MIHPRRSFAALAGVLVSLAIAAPTGALADPPPHAPAHGWRKKNDPHYVGYTGRQLAYDYGIRSGRCDRDRSHVATAVGAVAGGVIGFKSWGRRPPAHLDPCGRRDRRLDRQ